MNPLVANLCEEHQELIVRSNNNRYEHTKDMFEKKMKEIEHDVSVYDAHEAKRLAVNREMLTGLDQPEETVTLGNSIIIT